MTVPPIKETKIVRDASIQQLKANQSPIAISAYLVTKADPAKEFKRIKEILGLDSKKVSAIEADLKRRGMNV